ncbi:CDC48 family AAA ATPase [Patescibacteria group bacterium]|nr:CDC48 family AAA ATPase [Patescibacteria group bacterium]MBU4579652.1 CDC48 family AAA ATPase [Patescibacteria group bacterium]
MADKNSSKSIILKIAEAQSKDVGRAIARIDPEYFLKIQADTGDIIKLKVESEKHALEKHRGLKVKGQETVAKLMPTYQEDRGKGIAQIDGIARDNLGAGLDEKIEIYKTVCENARTVILTSLDSGDSFKEEDSQYLADILDGTPVIKGSKIRATFFGTKTQDFLVEDVEPDGAVVIKPSTLIKVKGASKEKRGIGITYEDIGGLSREIKKIREMIELPLKYPELFSRIGIDPPKGVLLYGPPGCGKTLIARAVVNETDAYFTHISGPEIMGKFYGESEGRLREIFEEARANTPAILFIDEIDAIAPKREDMGGEKQVERRVVAQLLALMDGLESRGQIIVIGATNIPNVLDPALRRPGRFDREIAIGIPDRNGRKKILEIHTRGMPLADDVDLEKLAEITHGFVGADLEALSREAAMSALREIMPEIEFEKEYIPYEKLRKIEVTLEHFREALKEVEPSALREVFAEIPNTKWEDVGGLENIKQILKEVIEWPLKYGDTFNYAGLTPSKGIMLYGPPGCGKTLFAKAVATELGANFISVKGPQLLSKYIGESEKGIREIFKKARLATPCIIFFDEIDSLAPKRGGNADSQVIERVVSQFLTELDGIEELKGVVVLGATNRLDMIDPALLRAGRFDFLLEIPKPDEKSRYAIFNIHSRSKPLDRDVDLKRLAKLTEGLNGSDIELICKKAAMAAIRENVNKKSVKQDKNFKISRKHFKEAMK